ncbi:uncharacterized protein BDV17DRAFT_249234 [Aspergillus undulatus]|uniref:uncharacterized protein n=1 Tax=Aspergillus undulatus TaxID=1810928 RepID=UPI003CCCC8E1
MSTISHYYEIGSPGQPVNQTTGQSPRRFLAPLSSHLALIGFLVMPLAFGDEEKSASVNKTAIVIVASILIGIAYSLSLFLVLYYSDERTFLVRSLLVPGLISNSLALLNVLLNIFCRGLLPLALLEILSLSFSVAFTSLYAVGALWLSSHGAREMSREVSDRETILLTDEEMQRQQLQRLLEQNSPRKSLSPRAVQKTYRVNHPDRINSFLPPRHEEGYFN